MYEGFNRTHNKQALEQVDGRVGTFKKGIQRPLPVLGSNKARCQVHGKGAASCDKRSDVIVIVAR